jgi:hypothetical protein
MVVIELIFMAGVCKIYRMWKEEHAWVAFVIYTVVCEVKCIGLLLYSTDSGILTMFHRCVTVRILVPSLCSIGLLLYSTDSGILTMFHRFVTVRILESSLCSIGLLRILGSSHYVPSVCNSTDSGVLTMFHRFVTVRILGSSLFFTGFFVNLSMLSTWTQLDLYSLTTLNFILIKEEFNFKARLYIMVPKIL